MLLKPALLALLVIAALQTGYAKEQTSLTEGRLDTETGEDRFRINMAFQVRSLSNQSTGESLLGYGMHLQLGYALEDKWALAVGLGQVFSSDDLQSLIFTETEVQLIYAVSSTLIRRKKKLSVSEYPVYSAEEYLHGGLRVAIQANQVFFSTSSSAVPFSGPGLESAYEWATKSNLALYVGGRIDFLRNSGTQITPIGIFSGIRF